MPSSTPISRFSSAPLAFCTMSHALRLWCRSTGGACIRALPADLCYALIQPIATESNVKVALVSFVQWRRIAYAWNTSHALVRTFAKGPGCYRVQPCFAENKDVPNSASCPLPPQLRKFCASEIPRPCRTWRTTINMMVRHLCDLFGPWHLPWGVFRGSVGETKLWPRALS